MSVQCTIKKQIKNQIKRRLNINVFALKLLVKVRKNVCNVDTVCNKYSIGSF